MGSFWKHEGHAPLPAVGVKWAKCGLVLLILNEIRGAAVVISLVWAYYF